MNQRIIDLQTRIKNLKSNRQAEIKGDNDARYISDLDETIAHCNRQLQFLNKNPDGVEMVNGV